MGKMLPVDTTKHWNSTDVRCSVCRKGFGGLIYDPETDTFRHRDPDECAGRKKSGRF